MPAFNFGVGSLWTARTDISNPTPAQFGTLQDIAIDFSFTNKPLMGQYQIAVAVARGGMKTTGKAKFATIDALVYNEAFFGQTRVAGLVTTSLNETSAIPGTPFSITPVNAATFTTDLGVFYSATGIRLTRVASGPTTGQYSVVVATGIYTFAAADTLLSVSISYAYTAATGGYKMVIANQLMGAAPTFQMNLTATYQSKVFSLQLNSCISSKLSMPFKNEDWMISEIDIDAFTDASNTLGTLSVTDL
jgi:hypothetical protein